MDEYIKREDALKATTYIGTAEPTDIIPLTLLAAQKNIRRIPAADVVPRAEVDKARQQGYESGKREVAREILEKAASKFAGHSDYHGDTILQVLYCMAEGKEVNNAKPLNSKQSEDVTDINDGHKPTEEGDYFTPAQVRVMSAAEVKANYSKIITSMSRWH